MRASTKSMWVSGVPYQSCGGAVVCVNCPQGTFGNTTGLSECPRCSAGRFANLVGQSACQDCPQGQQQHDVLDL
eukprot:515301-Amphidinium_carterae.1